MADLTRASRIGVFDIDASLCRRLLELKDFKALRKTSQQASDAPTEYGGELSLTAADDGIYGVRFRGNRAGAVGRLGIGPGAFFTARGS
jgi:hypothetical protein